MRVACDDVDRHGKTTGPGLYRGRPSVPLVVIGCGLADGNVIKNSATMVQIIQVGEWVKMKNIEKFLGK